MLSQDFIDQMKVKLLAEKERLSTDFAALSDHTELGPEYDDNIQEVEQDEVNTDLRARMESDLAKIDKALAKIEAGNYGIDDNGAEISEARLNAIPWADVAL